MSAALIDFLPARRSVPISVIGLDVGTSGSRAVVVEADGSISASATAPHDPFASPGPAWAEQDPDNWWTAGQQALRVVTGEARARGSSIDAVGLSGQMHGAVLLGERGEVLRPSIIWCDQRTSAECRWLDEHVGQSRLLELTLNPALTNFTLTRLLWVRTHEPEIWARVRHVLLPKDYVRLRLSGVYATDMADASGTLLLDVARRRWSDEMVAATGLRRDVLPDVYESPDVCAHVSADAAAATGLRRGHTHRGRRGRSGRRRGGHGHHAPGRRQRDDRHVRRRLRGDGASSARSQGADSHVLSRRAGPMARHGRDAGGRAVVALDARPDRRDRWTRRSNGRRRIRTPRR